MKGASPFCAQKYVRKEVMGVNDERIIELYWSRSEQAIAETDKKYGTMCRKIAGNLLRSDEDAEECVNDTYNGLWDAIPPARPQKLSSFIAKITRNLAMKRLTYRNAVKRALLTVSFEELEACIPAADSPEQVLHGKELTQALERFLDTLDRESRNMFLRRYWFFDSIEEIAKGFGVSQSKVKSQLFRVRNKLKLFLAEEVDIRVR